MTPTILIINGPNLNMLGHRDQALYGRRDLGSIIAGLRSLFASQAVIADFQSNCEGALIDRIQQAAPGSAAPADAIVINPGAYAHTSLALADALADSQLPAIEVHLTNIAAREPLRRTSLTAPCCRGVISGLGVDVYRLGVEAALQILTPTPSEP